MARVRLIVGLVALAAAAATVALVLVTRDPPGERVDAEPPPLFLDLALRDDAESRDLARAAQLYERGRLDDAREIFDRHSSPEARVGSAFARWPDRTLEALEELPANGVTQLHLGIALLALGRERDALTALARVDRIAPDTSYAVRSDDFSHPRMAPGLPFFVPTREPSGPLARALELRSLGRQVSARRAFDAAARRRPNDPETLTAAAVGAFDKDNPEVAFGRLGPLTRRFPRAQTVRFHLGVLLLWIADLEGSRRQLERARALNASSELGREASRFLERLESGGTS